MGKSFIFIRSNLRKSKGQAVAIAVLIMIATLMLNLWLMLSLDYKSNFARCHDRLNAEHVAVAAGAAADADGVKKMIDSDSRTAAYDVAAARLSLASMPYGDGLVNGNVVFMEKSAAVDRTVGKTEIIEEDADIDGVYLPYTYKTEVNTIGSKIKFTIYDRDAEYKIAGFHNSVMLGSHNCGMFQVLFTADAYKDFCEKNYAPEANLYSVRIKNIDDCEKYCSDLTAKIKETYPAVIIGSAKYDAVLSARYITQGVFSAVISIMAFLVLLIALIVLFSNIINYIQVNMKNLGVLKAIGYVSRQIVGALVLQFALISLASALVGMALSYAVFPAINSMMITQTGIPYAVRFLVLPALLSLVIPCAAVALAVLLACRKIKRIQPIVALRSGGETHSAKHNPIPLEKTKRMPVNVALALKTTLSGIKQNVTVIITMLVLSLVVVFSAMMTTNIITDSQTFLDIIVGETADAAVNVAPVSQAEFVADMSADPNVEKIYMYSSEEIAHKGGSGLTVTIIDDFSKLNNQRIIVEGVSPRSEKEIAIAIKYARDNDIKVGDSITVAADGKEATYTVSGFTQLTNQLGKDCLMLDSGYARLTEQTSVRYYINVRSGADIPAFLKGIEDAHKYIGLMTFNINEILEGSMSVYVTLMKVIVFAILLISVLIITFVLYLLVRTLLNNKKRDYGVLKSIGFTTRQLVAQTAMSFMPAIIVATVLGLTVSCLIMNPLMSVFLSAVGILKSTFTVPVGLVVGMGAALLALSFGIACLLSVRVRKITPKELLLGE